MIYDEVTTVKSFWANIYVGLRKGYSNDIEIKDLVVACEYYCSENNCAVTFTKTDFIYNNGKEPGVIVGLINYPRYPSEPIDLIKQACALAQILKKTAHQERVTVVTPLDTYMYGSVK